MTEEIPDASERKVAGWLAVSSQAYYLPCRGQSKRSRGKGLRCQCRLDDSIFCAARVRFEKAPGIWLGHVQYRNGVQGKGIPAWRSLRAKRLCNEREMDC